MQINKQETTKRISISLLYSVSSCHFKSSFCLNKCSDCSIMVTFCQIRYRFYVCYFTEPCLRYLTGSSGYITSPFYPENYSNNANCTYDINSPGAIFLTLQFIELDIQCCCDKLQFYVESSGNKLQLYNRLQFNSIK